MSCSFFNLMKQELCSLLSLLLVVLWTRSEVVKKKNRTIAKNLISKKKKTLAMFHVQNKLLSLFWGQSGDVSEKKAIVRTSQGSIPWRRVRVEGRTTWHLRHLLWWRTSGKSLSTCFSVHLHKGCWWERGPGYLVKVTLKACFYWWFTLQPEKGGFWKGDVRIF